MSTFTAKAAGWRVYWIEKVDHDTVYFAYGPGPTVSPFRGRKEAEEFMKEIAKNPQIIQTWLAFELG